MQTNITQATAGSLQTSSSVRGVLASLCLTMLLSSLGTSVANVALPGWVTVFNASLQEVQWVVLAYLLAVTSLIISAGRLGDMLGRRRLMMMGLTLFTAASLICAAANSLWLLIGARLLQGAGAAAMMSLTMALVGETLPKNKAGSAMGLLGTMSALGTALGPALGGVLIDSLGWRFIFLINLPVGLVALGLAWRYLPSDRPAAQRTRFDHLGTLLLVITLVSYALAVTLGKGHFNALNLWLLLVAALGLGLFLFIQTRATAPLINLAIFRHPSLSAGFATSTLVATVIMATLVVGPFYLSGALALEPATIGLVMSCGPVVSAIVGIPAGHLVDQLGAHRLGISGLIAIFAGATSLCLLPVRWGIPAYVLPLIITTTGYALFQAANNTGVMANAGAQERGAVAGMLNLSRNLGLITGASVMGAVFAFGSSCAVITTHADAVARGMHLTFALGSVLIFIAITIAFFSQKSSTGAQI